MKHKTLSVCLLLAGVWLAAPVLVSAEGLPYSGAGWNAGNPLIRHVQAPTMDRCYYCSSSFSEMNKSEKESRDAKSSGELGLTTSPSPDISPSVHGHPWWDRSSGDPSVKDLSGMGGIDRGGFAPPDSYTGSPRRP